MIVLTLAEVRIRVQEVLSGKRPLAALREYIFLVHEGEEVEVEVALNRLLPALEPYFLYEEACGDPDAAERLQRLAQVLALEDVSREHIVFALEFNEAREAVSKRQRGVITDATLVSVLSKLSPIEFDVAKVERWAFHHQRLGALDVRLLV
jgi:hypothetical protein